MDSAREFASHWFEESPTNSRRDRLTAAIEARDREWSERLSAESRSRRDEREASDVDFCPFCGSTASVVIAGRETFGNWFMAQVACDNREECAATGKSCSGPVRKTARQEAVDAWNRRAAHPVNPDKP